MFDFQILRLKAFKRQYHRARRANERLQDTTPLKMEMRLTSVDSSINLSLPEKEISILFLVSMRRFLQANDPLALETILEILETHFVGTLK